MADLRPTAYAIFIFFLMGLGTLFPWNAFLASSAFFSRITDEKNDVNRYAIVSYLVANLITAALTLLPMSKRTDKALAIGAFVTHFCVLIAVIIIASKPQSADWSADVLYAATLLLFSVTGAATAVMQTNLFAIAGKMHSACITWMLFGQGIAGIGTALINLILGYLTPRDNSGKKEDMELIQQRLSQAYFSICLGVMVVTLLFYLRLPNVLKNEQRRAENSRASIESAIPNSPIAGDSAVAAKFDEASPSSAGFPVAHTEQPLSSFALLKLVYPFAAVVCADLALTLTVFPAVTMKLRGSTGVDLWLNNRWAEWSFVIYNVFDSVGRFLPGMLGSVYVFWATRRSRQRGEATPRKATQNLRIMVLVTLSALRILFLILLPLCELSVGPESIYKQFKKFDVALFKDNVMPGLFLLLLGLSNGAIASACFVYSQLTRVPVANGSSQKRDLLNAERGIVGRIITFSLLSGLVVGSSLTLLYEMAIYIKKD